MVPYFRLLAPLTNIRASVFSPPPSPLGWRHFWMVPNVYFMLYLLIYSSEILVQGMNITGICIFFLKPLIDWLIDNSWGFWSENFSLKKWPLRRIFFFIFVRWVSSKFIHRGSDWLGLSFWKSSGSNLCLFLFWEDKGDISQRALRT